MSICAFRPEEELLLCCCHSRIEPAIAERITKLAQEPIDWEYFLQIASRHEVLPLAYQSLKQTCLQAVPKDILSQLLQEFHANTVYNQSLKQELLKILKIFSAHDIFAIPFKGLILAITAYKSVTLRQFGDLDILIRPIDVANATNILVSQGYQLPDQLAELQTRPYLQYEQFLESGTYQGSYDFIRYDNHVMVELHWSLTRQDFSYEVNFQDLWERVELIELEDTLVPNLSPEDLLIYLCFHGSKHCWESLKWICDVAELLNTYPNLNWKQVIEQSRRLGVEQMLGVGLLLTNQLLKTPISCPLWQQIQTNTTVRSLTEQVCHQLFQETLSEFDKHLFLMRVRKRLWDKVLYIRHLILTPTEQEWNLLPLPAFLSFFYYPIRLLTLSFNWKNYLKLYTNIKK